jgi:hypothetical protein
MQASMMNFVKSAFDADILIYMVEIEQDLKDEAFFNKIYIQKYLFFIVE